MRSRTNMFFFLEEIIDEISRKNCMGLVTDKNPVPVYPIHYLTEFGVPLVINRFGITFIESCRVCWKFDFFP